MDGLDAVGLAYLAQLPHDVSPDALRRVLGLGPDEDPFRDRRLARQVGDDFARADIVCIDGWRLSRTEARAAALHHLENA